MAPLLAGFIEMDEADAAASSKGITASADPIAIKCAGRTRSTCSSSTRTSQHLKLPSFDVEPEPQPTETLAGALEAAYRTAPALAAQRYQLRATDEDYAQAIAELNPTSTFEIVGGYGRTVPDRTTQARVSVVQPLYTGGRATADREAALAAVGAGREQLRGGEGDLLLQVITSYADIRRDSEVLRLRAANLKQLTATLDEVKARREAGELTRTDIAQAETQLLLAQAQFNVAEQQYEADRATYAALVGHDPGALAPSPPLPQLPGSIDMAFDLAYTSNPDLARAIATERASRARIAAARADGRPTVSLRGSANFIGQVAPLNLVNGNQVFDGQAVLTIPLITGGRVRSLVAQAQDRNAVDRVGIEAMRRRVVERIVTSWNAIATGQRNVEVGKAQLASARVFDEGTFEEYRAGLRSTFDVLFAHGSLRDAEIALVNARRDTYVAQATLLRHIGFLEARALLTGTGLHHPDLHFDKINNRARVPWAGAVQALDRVYSTRPSQAGLEQPSAGEGDPAIVPAPEQPKISPARTSPVVPIPGTTGRPLSDRSLKRP
ncbi:MAG: TolC family protein [Sphingomonas sp.]|nr:TolC family protein [Sphingomonas sp.]